MNLNYIGFHRLSWYRSLGDLMKFLDLDSSKNEYVRPPNVSDAKPNDALLY